MKTTVYYFTGTGNSLWVSKGLAEQLSEKTGMSTDFCRGEAELIPIAKVMRSENPVKLPKGAVGIVCPVYQGGIPLIVTEFIEKADFTLPDYIFIVLTYGAYTASAEDIAYKQMKNSGRAPDYVNKIKMADNYLPIFTPPSGEKLDLLMKSAEAELNIVAKDIAGRKGKIPKSGIIAELISKFMYGDLRRKGHVKDKKFHAEDSCNGCGTCAKVCPVENITIENQKPVRHHNCEFCFACLHLCPKKAIQYKNSTKKKPRYKHPEINISELMRK
jgi:ferredoxin